MWNIFLYKESYSGGVIHYYYDIFKVGGLLCNE